MARIYQDGFEFNTTTTNNNTYDTFSGSTIGTTHARTGTYGLRVSSLTSTTAQGALKKWLASASGGPYYLRAYGYIVTLPSASNTIMYFGAATTLGGSVRCYITLETNGTLILRNSAGTQIGSASGAINDSTFHMVELQTNATPASGSRVIEARLDGSVFATSSTQTQSTSLSFAVGGNLNSEAQTTGEWWFDDIALNDSTGSSQTTYPGSGKILQLYPNATGDVNGFLVQIGGTAGSANNYTRVNEIPPNDATSYNASAVLNAQDLFAVQNSGIGASDTVNTVLVGARFANITGASATSAIEFQIEKTSGGTIASSSAIVPDTTSWNTNGTSVPRNYQLVTYNDPDGAAWTQATLDSMQIGYKLTATLTDAVGLTNIWASADFTPAAAPPPASVGSTLLMMGVG